MDQQEFNHIIDLLGDALTAEAAAESIPKHLNRQSAMTGAKKALDDYMNAVKALYPDSPIPAVFADTFQNKCRSESMRASGSTDGSFNSNTRVLYSADITGLMSQLNKDFVMPPDSQEEDIVIAAYEYTGRYIHYDPLGDYIATPDRSKPMKVLYCAAAPIVVKKISVGHRFLLEALASLELLAAGILALSIGMLAIFVPGGNLAIGIALSVAGGIMIGAYTANRFGFFKSKNDPLDPEVGEAPQFQV